MQHYANLIVFFSIFIVFTLLPGGLVGRGLVHIMDDHKVDTFITLSSPLNGQYGGIIPNIFVIIKKC